MLKAFVSGFPRFSARAPIPEIGTALRRADQFQALYIASLKIGMPRPVSEELAHWAKIHIDQCSRQPLKDADIFLFYNGCGLESARWFQRNGGIGIVEAVNSHVHVQEQLLSEEYRRAGLPWRPFHPREVKRRAAEVEEADYVLLPSTFVARSFLAKGIPRERLLRLPYPIQNIPGASAPVRTAKDDDGVFRVLYVGSISVRKGLTYLIEAFRRLKHSNKELWIVGPTAKPSGIENLSLPAGVKFFGTLKGDELQAVYARATVFCLPSIEEGLALVLSEAMNYGLPVIATENTGIEDLLVEGKGGMVVPIRDANAIADFMNRLAEDGNFLALKRNEAVETAARLKEQSQTAAGLPTILMKTFDRHQAKTNKLN